MRFAGSRVPYISFIQFFRDQPKPMFYATYIHIFENSLEIVFDR